MSDQPVHEYLLKITRTADGAAFGPRTVPRSQLEPACEQMVFLAQRRGMIGPEPNGANVTEEPLFTRPDEDEITGVALAIRGGGRQIRRRLSVENLFGAYVSTSTAQLLAANQLAGADTIHYRVYARRREAAKAVDNVVARVGRQSLIVGEGQLDDWLADAEAVGPIGDRDHPVFIPDSVLELSRQYSWQRGSEGGCWLIGRLYRQTEPTHEIFSVIDTVIHARGMTHSRFGLDLSTETYTHLADQLQRRRARPGHAGELAMGFYHTHPFLPSDLDDGEACGTCAKRAECRLSSAALFSQKDALFHKAIFGHTAYAVEFVLGLTPREEFDLRAFAMDGGQFRERGFYRVGRKKEEAMATAATVG
ncbi:MAG: hypothetical protein GXY83_26150 [Rhodopirellula sp.]|nr:hypothetical protein [Rhodopirellula sp.]